MMKVLLNINWSYVKKVKRNYENVEADIHLYPGVFHSYWHESARQLTVVRRGTGTYVSVKDEEEAKADSINRLYGWMTRYFLN